MAPLLLVGPALSVELGLGPALGLLLLTLVIADRRAAWAGASLAEGASDAPLRWLGALAIVVVAAVLVAVGAGTIAAVTIAFPAAIWTLVLGLGLGLVGARLDPRRPRARLALILVGALAIPAVAARGEAHEAAAVDARGSATSGPILGVHPFQVVAVVIDGFGPFDIPFNDYVEPDGSRGYSPQAFAEALERALHRIAELHFAAGPARARRAFAGATVAALEVPATSERSDMERPPGPEPRFVVRSGSHGQRSRVEFVCPGLLEDPRGRGEDDVMERMCPARHAAEGSAGLGVTGRWTGYTEARGNERVGLGQLLGWTRSDDAVGRRSRRNEARVTAFAVIALGLLLALGRRPTVRAASRTIEGWGAWTLGLGAAALSALLLLGLKAPVIGVALRPPATTDLMMWLPLAVIFAGVGELAEFEPEAQQRARRRRWAAAALILLATLAVAASPGMSAWIRPELWPHTGLHGEFTGFEAWIAALGERAHLAFGLDLAVAEAVVASIVVAGALGLCVHASQTLGAAATTVLGPRGGRWARLGPALGIAALAAGLVLSRQTEGGSLLLGPGLLLSATVVAARSTATAPRRRLTAGILLVVSAALTLAALAAVWSQGASPRPILGVYLGLGAALTLALMVAGLLSRPRSGP